MEEVSVIAQKMNDEHVEIIKTYMIRIVMEKIPKAKRWSVAKEFKSFERQASYGD
jgi:hypothetical protein